MKCLLFATPMDKVDRMEFDLGNLKTESEMNQTEKFPINS